MMSDEFGYAVIQLYGYPVNIEVVSSEILWFPSREGLGVCINDKKLIIKY